MPVLDHRDALAAPAPVSARSAAAAGESGGWFKQSRPEAIAADAGYWNEKHMDEVVADRHIPVLVAPDKGSRDTPSRWLNSGRATWARAVLGSEHGRERYAKRKQTVEPLYGDTKHNRGFTRFHRRGRMKVRTEFRLLMMAHNLTKVHRRHLATQAA